MESDAVRAALDNISTQQKSMAALFASQEERMEARERRLEEKNEK
jgi:hypothetical protein